MKQVMNFHTVKYCFKFINCFTTTGTNNVYAIIDKVEANNTDANHLNNCDKKVVL